MQSPRLVAFLCILSVLSFSVPASAEVFSSPVDAKPSKTGSQMEATLKAIARLTSQNRGEDALNLLKNAVDNNLIPSDHKAALSMNAQDDQTMAVLNSNQQMNAAQVIQVMNRLCNMRRGDDAVLLYTNALEQGIITATPY